MNLLSIDGRLYKFANLLYYLFVSSILWVIFSLPLLTIGASTTALFFVMGKIVRNDNVSILKNFWTSFKLNLKQAILIWIALVFAYFILCVNIMNVHVFGNLAVYIRPVQIFIAVELLLLTIYIFPLLSRYDMTALNLLKTSLFMGNRHFLTTMLCIFSFFIVSVLVYSFTSLFILIAPSLYALCSYYLMHRVFQKYLPGDNTEERAV